MSLPFDGFKAAQTGLVDMGNISFYNTGATPIFNPFGAGAVQHQLQRDRAERHLGAAAGHARLARHVVHRQRDPAGQPVQQHLPHRPRHQAQGVGRLHRAHLGQGDQRRSDHGHRPERGRSRLVRSPDDRPVLDCRLHQRLAEPAERARHQVRRHGDHPRHLADRRGLRHRRTLRAVADERGRVVQPRRRHGEPDRPAADGRLQRCRRNADAARGDRRLLSMVDDAARLHHQRASTCSTAATS